MNRNPELAPVLALDLGDVCVRVELPALLEMMGFASMAEFSAFDHDGKVFGLCWEVQSGRVTPEQFLEEFGRRLPVPQSPAATLETWNSLLGAEIPGVAEVVAEAIAAKLELVFISNICPFHYQVVCDRLSFVKAATGAVLSYQVGARKPDPPMFAALERDYCDGKPPLLYADDGPDNIAAAQTRNWPVYHFGDVAGLRARLHAQLALL